jgi:hypothetical protein
MRSVVQVQGERSVDIVATEEKEEQDDGEFEHEDGEEVQKLDWQQIFLQEKMMGEPQSIPQSIIYELVNETINKEAFNISCPRGKDLTLLNILKYLALMPLTHT